MYTNNNNNLNYSHPRGYSDDFGSNEVDPWYSNSPEKITQQKQQTTSLNYSNPLNNSNGNINNYNTNDNNINYTGRFDLNDDIDYENEPPLLEEIGIRFDHIWDKTRAVIMINQVYSLFSIITYY